MESEGRTTNAYINDYGDTLTKVVETANKLFIGVDNAKVILLNETPFEIINNTASFDPKTRRHLLKNVSTTKTLIIGGISDKGSIAFIRLRKNTTKVEVIHGEEGQYVGVVALDGKIRRKTLRALPSRNTSIRENKPIILIPKEVGYNVLFIGKPTIISSRAVSVFKVTSSLLKPLINKLVLVKLYNISSYIRRSKKNVLGFIGDLMLNEEAVRMDLVVENSVNVKRNSTKINGEEYENGCIEIRLTLNSNDLHALLVYLPYDVMRAIENGNIPLRRKVYLLERSNNKKALYLYNIKGGTFITGIRTLRKYVNTPPVDEALKHVIDEFTFHDVPVQKNGTVYLVRKDLTEYIGYFAVVKADGETFVEPIVSYRSGNNEYGKIVFTLKPGKRKVTAHVYVFYIQPKPT